MSLRLSTWALLALGALLVLALPSTPAHASRDRCEGATMPTHVARVLHDQAAAAHVSPRWAHSGDLAFLLCHESGFDWCAVNPSRHDCAYAGTDSSCGLFQRLPCPQRIYHDRRRQARNGLAYIASRYGNPAVAARHWRTHHSY